MMMCFSHLFSYFLSSLFLLLQQVMFQPKYMYFMILNKRSITSIKSKERNSLTYDDECYCFSLLLYTPSSSSIRILDYIFFVFVILCRIQFRKKFRIRMGKVIKHSFFFFFVVITTTMDNSFSFL